MNTTLTTPPPEANTAPDKDGKGVVSAAPGSALDAALALVDFGSCRGAERPQDWLNVAGPMCEHCEGEEDVNLAAARIIATEYRKALAVISAIEERYIDGCDTYEDWKFMGTTAREYLLPPNENGEKPRTESAESTRDLKSGFSPPNCSASTSL